MSNPKDKVEKHFNKHAGKYLAGALGTVYLGQKLYRRNNIFDKNESQEKDSMKHFDPESIKNFEDEMLKEISINRQKFKDDLLKDIDKK